MTSRRVITPSKVWLLRTTGINIIFSDHPLANRRNACGQIVVKMVRDYTFIKGQSEAPYLQHLLMVTTPTHHLVLIDNRKAKATFRPNLTQIILNCIRLQKDNHTHGRGGDRPARLSRCPPDLHVGQGLLIMVATVGIVKFVWLGFVPDWPDQSHPHWPQPPVTKTALSFKSQSLDVSAVPTIKAHLQTHSLGRFSVMAPDVNLLNSFRDLPHLLFVEPVISKFFPDKSDALSTAFYIWHGWSRF